MAITNDTSAANRALEAAGADSDLVTKADLKTEFAALDGRMSAAGYRLAFGVVVANAAIVFGLLKFLLPA